MKAFDLSREWFIREIASRSGFTIGDIRVLINTIEDVVKDVVSQKKTLLLKRLFKISYVEIREHKGWDPYYQKHVDRPTVYKVVFQPSKALTNLIKK